jgi:hypothetical protein
VTRLHESRRRSVFRFRVGTKPFPPSRCQFRVCRPRRRGTRRAPAEPRRRDSSLTDCVRFPDSPGQGQFQVRRFQVTNSKLGSDAARPRVMKLIASERESVIRRGQACGDVETNKNHMLAAMPQHLGGLTNTCLKLSSVHFGSINFAAEHSSVKDIYDQTCLSYRLVQELNWHA